MEQFDLEEAEEKEPKDQATAVNRLNKDQHLKDLALKATNLVEASAMTFIEGVANEEMAFMPLSETLCSFVEHFYFCYCGMRNRGKLNRYEYTIKLYRKWSQRRKVHELDVAQRSLSNERARAVVEAAPVGPIGATKRT
jgi:hypothetical protein